ncbi:MAG TPA: hypothetical protein VEA17_06695 [Bordetella sp.]|nr:hypothetical protein [Bordetella sp.]
MGSAARWLGWLNAIGALVEVGFALGVLGADVAPPDLSVPLAIFLTGVLAGASAMLCWGLAQAARAGSRCSKAATWLGAIAYIVAMGAFVAGCWLSAGLAFDAADSQVGAAYTALAGVF